jgi:hypothetical protein
MAPEAKVFEVRTAPLKYSRINVAESRVFLAERRGEACVGGDEKVIAAAVG